MGRSHGGVTASNENCGAGDNSPPHHNSHWRQLHLDGFCPSEVFLMKAIRQKSAVWFVTILAFLIYSGSTFAQSPSFSTSASAVPACGQLDDGLVHVPPTYNSFTPPPEGQANVDPPYGCTLTRLTYSTHDSPIVPRHQHYATLTPFNANSSEVMVFLDNGSNDIR